ncbi:hypothetical protein Mgra_00007199 [Meloidogyne graminicola]|uniref:Uncharacterized protein n=1 Tax=Meloidogyne graminicola TaxID=189291 RepID=A0A8S9ZJ73_9BILA|nr:hypothetical protein Mgra_00007199 [Meloidogyne graminicola]
MNIEQLKQQKYIKKVIPNELLINIFKSLKTNRFKEDFNDKTKFKTTMKKLLNYKKNLLISCSIINSVFGEANQKYIGI